MSPDHKKLWSGDKWAKNQAYERVKCEIKMDPIYPLPGEHDLSSILAFIPQVARWKRPRGATSSQQVQWPRTLGPVLRLWHNTLLMMGRSNGKSWLLRLVLIKVIKSDLRHLQQSGCKRGLTLIGSLMDPTRPLDSCTFRPAL